MDPTHPHHHQYSYQQRPEQQDKLHPQYSVRPPLSPPKLPQLLVQQHHQQSPSSTHYDYLPNNRSSIPKVAQPPQYKTQSQPYNNTASSPNNVPFTSNSQVNRSNSESAPGQQQQSRSALSMSDIVHPKESTPPPVRNRATVYDILNPIQ